MSRRDLRPLSKEAARRIEWVKAQHEIKIREAMLAWHTEGLNSNHAPPMLTSEQQAHLQNLLVEMSVQLGEREGREYLAVMPPPQQFEMDIHHLMESVACEARERWKLLIVEFRLEECQSESVDPDSVVYGRVREMLRPSADLLIRDAWTAHKDRLQAEFDFGPADDVSAEPAYTLASVSARAVAAPSATLSHRIEQLRIDKGMSVEQLALEAGVDKKTILGITKKRRHAMPFTLKKLADALGVSASELLE